MLCFREILYYWNHAPSYSKYVLSKPRTIQSAYLPIQTSYHFIQSAYYPNLVLSKLRTIQTAYHPNRVPIYPNCIPSKPRTIQTSYHNIQNAYFPNLVQSKPSSVTSKIRTFQTANHMLKGRQILINFASWWRLNFFSKTFTIVTSIINTNWIMNDFFGNHSHAAKLYMYNSDNLVAETRLLCCSSKYVSKF